MISRRLAGVCRTPREHSLINLIMLNICRKYAWAKKRGWRSDPCQMFDTFRSTYLICFVEFKSRKLWSFFSMCDFIYILATWQSFGHFYLHFHPEFIHNSRSTKCSSVECVAHAKWVKIHERKSEKWKKNFLVMRQIDWVVTFRRKWNKK